MKIFLIGYMGCGKSRMGKNMAAKTGRPLIDLDTFIEVSQQLSIPEIFALKGESGFREIEKNALQNAAMAPNAIVSTGGGAPCFFNNMEWMNENGITIFIDPPVKVLADRLINAKTERPLIKGKSYEELLSFIDDKLSERRPFYEQAQIVLKGIDLSPDDLIQTLKNRGINV